MAIQQNGRIAALLLAVRYATAPLTPLTAPPPVHALSNNMRMPTNPKDNPGRAASALVFLP